MNHWRPKNWASIKYYNISREIYDTHEVELGYQFFEAGADAILEAIFKLAEESPTKTFTFDAQFINIFREG